MAVDPVTPERGGAQVFEWVALCILASTSACGSGEPPPLDPFGAEGWTLGTPDVRIGSVDDPDHTFSSVWDLAVAPDETVFSLHPGRVRAPIDFRILEVTDGAVWGVETDELEVEYIVRRPILRDTVGES